MNRTRLQFATVVFLTEMRRQAAKTSKGVEIQSLNDYPPDQRSALMSGIEKAIKATNPDADTAFDKWFEKQQKSENCI
jgi:hypothetical protein